MAGSDVASPAVERYLDAVAAGLAGPRSARVAILDELRDGLHDAIAARVQRGGSPVEAVPAALAEFGAPAVTARGFAGELASSQARRTVAAYLVTGPLVGLLWLLTLAPSHWWRDGPAALWSVLTPAPAIVLGCGVGAVVLAATGRASRWMSPPRGRVVHGALIVVAVAMFADVLMLVLATRPDSSAGSSIIGVLAITASTSRLGLSIPATARCLRARRIARAKPNSH